MNDLFPLSFDYSTAQKLLDLVTKIEWMVEILTEFESPFIDQSFLRVPNSSETEFLMQSELLAIQ